MPKRFKDRKWALERIANAKSPTREAKRLIKWFTERGTYKGAVLASDNPATDDIEDDGTQLVWYVPRHNGVGDALPQPRKKVLDCEPGDTSVDLSDVHELRVALYLKNGRHGWHLSDPQYRLLNALECDVAKGKVTDREDFNKRAAILTNCTGGLLANSYCVRQAKILAGGQQALGCSAPQRKVLAAQTQCGAFPPMQLAPKGTRLFETDTQFDERDELLLAA